MINSATKADQAYTVEQFVDMKSADDITYYNYSILAYLNGFEYTISNILDDYIDELEEESVVLKLDEKNMIKYKYKPWLLAYDIYGSTEAYFIIFLLNGIISDREFDFNRIRILRPQSMYTLLGRIYSANANYLNNNKSSINTQQKNIEADWVW